MRASERKALVRKTVAGTLRSVATAMRKCGADVQLYAGGRSCALWAYLLELQAADVERRSARKGSSRS